MLDLASAGVLHHVVGSDERMPRQPCAGIHQPSLPALGQRQDELRGRFGIDRAVFLPLTGR
jgi:hypothetical protein